MSDVAVAALVIVACLGAFLFAVAPVIPGSVLVPVAAIGIGVITGFERFPWWFWVGQVVIVTLSIAVDNVAQVVGVKKLGGSKRAMIGGTIGVLVGPLLLAPILNLFAVLVGPPVGAVVGTLLGELWHRRRTSRQGDELVQPTGSLTRIGAGAFLAWMGASAVRLALALVQVAWLLLEL